MQLSDIITPDRVVVQVNAKSRKRALEYLSDIIATHSTANLNAHDIFDRLIARERLGTTALDHGIAIPHGRMANSTETIGAFIQLSQGIDCDANDKQDVNLLFALLVPKESTDEHLEILARLAKMFSNEDLRNQLRLASDSQSLYNILIGWDTSH